MKKIELKPIGSVFSPVQKCIDENWGNIKSRIILEPELEGTLLGLDGFSHAIIVTYLHHAQYEKELHFQRRPRNLPTMPKLGIFSQRAKNRPNPIGITAVEIVEVGSNFVEVKGLDAIDKTPVLDIKPYFPDYDKIDKPVVPEWVNKLMKGYFLSMP